MYQSFKLVGHVKLQKKLNYLEMWSTRLVQQINIIITVYCNVSAPSYILHCYNNIKCYMYSKYLITYQQLQSFPNIISSQKKPGTHHQPLAHFHQDLLAQNWHGHSPVHPHPLMANKQDRIAQMECKKLKTTHIQVTLPFSLNALQMTFNFVRTAIVTEKTIATELCNLYSHTSVRNYDA